MVLATRGHRPAGWGWQFIPPARAIIDASTALALLPLIVAHPGQLVADDRPGRHHGDPLAGAFHELAEPRQRGADRFALEFLFRAPREAVVEAGIGGAEGAEFGVGDLELGRDRLPGRPTRAEFGGVVEKGQLFGHEAGHGSP